MAAAEMSTTQLQALLEQGADGAASAYDTMLSQVSDRLFRLTRKMLRAYPHLRRWEQTDDVFQTAAFKLHRSLSDVRPSSVAAFWGLATTQIRRTLIDLARHHFGPEGGAANHESHPAADTSTVGNPRAANQAAGADSGPESLAEWAEFHTLIDQLPEEERDIFQLIWYAGLPQKEIAELLHISLPTVQRRWYAAQLHLFELTHGQRPPLDGEAPR